MANKLYEETDIQNIANAIRNKNRTQKTYKVSEMSSAVDEISVSSIIDVNTNKIKFGYSTFSSLSNIYDFSNVTDFSYMFSNCNFITTIPLINTSKGKDFSYMFSECSEITTIPLIDTNGGTNFMKMFFRCSNLNTIPLINTSKAGVTSWMFRECRKITTIPLIDTGKVQIFGNMFGYCDTLTTVPQLNTSKGIDFRDMFVGCPSLSNESLNNILAMCINATSYTGTKTLSALGLSSTDYSSSTIQSLSNYSDFVSAGWSIGY